MTKPSIAPQRWNPPKAPKQAATSSGPVRVDVVDLPASGPEDVILDTDGSILAGLADGSIVRVATTGEVRTLANTGGHPLGLELLPDGRLVVCDSHRGLLRVDLSSGAVETLVESIGGEPMVFCSNAVVARDGTVYFSESSQHVHVDHFTADVLEHSRTGRLSRLLPDGTVEVIADGLRFANGLVLAEDESWIAVAETTGYCITRIWLRGDQAGQREPIVENMPGFPDNMSRGSDGLIWVAIASARNPLLDFLLPRAPIFRKVVWALPDALRPKEKKMLWVQAYREDGTLVHDLRATHERFHMATGVVEKDGTIWVGSLVAPTIAILTRPGESRAA